MKYIDVIGQRQERLLFWLSILILAILPLPLVVAIWVWLDPVTFWEKVILFFIEVAVVYPVLLNIELFILALLE